VAGRRAQPARRCRRLGYRRATRSATPCSGAGLPAEVLLEVSIPVRRGHAQLRCRATPRRLAPRSATSSSGCGHLDQTLSCRRQRSMFCLRRPRLNAGLICAHRALHVVQSKFQEPAQCSHDGGCPRFVSWPSRLWWQARNDTRAIKMACDLVFGSIQGFLEKHHQVAPSASLTCSASSSLSGEGPVQITCGWWLRRRPSFPRGSHVDGASAAQHRYCDGIH